MLLVCFWGFSPRFWLARTWGLLLAGQSWGSEVGAGAFKEPLGAALQGAGRGFPRALGQRGFSVGLLLH